jgi:hypothetical protein
MNTIYSHEADYQASMNAFFAQQTTDLTASRSCANVPTSAAFTRQNRNQTNNQ